MKAQGETAPNGKVVSGGKTFGVYNVAGLEGVDRTSYLKRPLAQKILLENLFRNALRGIGDLSKVKELANGAAAKDVEFPFFPSRVLLQDFTGIPVIVDLSSMRNAAQKQGRDPRTVDSSVRLDLVVDHSVQVDSYGSPQSLSINIEREYERNGERYAYLKWAQKAFPKLRVMPPGNGICHQVNIEYLASVVTAEGETAYPDTLIGTDSHTTMVNGLGVMGWGVGGIEAEAVMLGEPYMMGFPRVVGVRLEGTPPPGTTATDIVLTVTRMLRKEGVVNKFVEFYGPGLELLSVPDRATVSNMSPEYGATASLFPVDKATLAYLRMTGRSPEQIQLVEDYAKLLGLWRDASSPPPEVEKELVLNLGDIHPTLSGPRNPEEARRLSEVPASYREALQAYRKDHPGKGGKGSPNDGRIAIAAITSCTNTSNPRVLLGAGLIAKRALELGLKLDPFVKASLAPGSKVVTSYLERAGLLQPLTDLGFALVGYGCTTCIGNSGPLSPLGDKAAEEEDAFLAAVLSGNRNFEARIHNKVRANYLGSPMLVVLAALAGRIDGDLSKDPIARSPQGKEVFLKDLWPSEAEIDQLREKVMGRDMFAQNYVDSYEGGKLWDGLHVQEGMTYAWEEDSTYLREVPFFALPVPEQPASDGTLLSGARTLALLGDNVSTDHISPAGEIPSQSPAGKYLTQHGVAPVDFNTYGSRRGNHEVLVRGTFANTRLKNYMVPEKDGGWTLHVPTGTTESIYDASHRYLEAGTPLLILAGKRYGQGSSRDWAAKGPRLLGVRAVIAESYERIHRSNLAGMGVLPLEFQDGAGWKSLGLTGRETFNLRLREGKFTPGGLVDVVAKDGEKETRFTAKLRLENPVELAYYQQGGVLPYALNQLASRKNARVP